MIAQHTLDLRPLPRKMPSILSIAEYWLDQTDDLPNYPQRAYDLGEPCCAACGWIVPEREDDEDVSLQVLWRRAARFLDRAHLVDHCSDGQDDAANLLPLCHLCHKRMPSFHVGERTAALRWIQRTPPRPWWWQLATDHQFELHPDWVHGRDQVQSLMRQLWVQCLESLVAQKVRAATKEDSPAFEVPGESEGGRRVSADDPRAA